MKKNLISIAVVAILGGVACGASAQEGVAPASGGIAWGPVMAYPSVDLTYKNNDNLFSQPDGPNKKSSDILVITPAARLEAKTGANTFGVGLRVEDGTVFNSRPDNYTDYQIGADAALALSGAAGLKIRADYNQGHDERGAIVGAGIGPTPSRYLTTGVSGVFGYGTPGAPGRFELDGGYLAKRYDNNQFLSPTTGTRFEDHDESRYGGTFYWRVMPKTKIVVQAGQTSFDYNNSVFSSAGLKQRDSVETRFLTGVTWDATYATSGTLKVGYIDKNFKSSQVQDYSGASWDASISWLPLSYSNVNFFASRKPNEASYGSSTMDTATGLGWTHAWNSRMSSILSYNHVRQDYKGLGFERRDSTDYAGAKLTYQVQRSLKIGAGYDYTDRSSTAVGSDYNRNVFSVFLTGAL